MSQRSDLLDFKMAKARSYFQREKRFLEMPDVANTHNHLLQYGIKEPYATNILKRLFSEAYELLINQPQKK